MAPCVVGGNFKRYFRYIQSDDPCRGRVFRDRDCDSARTGPEVEHRRGRTPAQKIQRRLYHGLGLGTRDEHAGTDRDLERKEFALPDDIGERLAGRAPRDHLLEAS